jgi:hypothetical protein
MACVHRFVKGWHGDEPVHVKDCKVLGKVRELQLKPSYQPKEGNLRKREAVDDDISRNIKRRKLDGCDKHKRERRRRRKSGWKSGLKRGICKGEVRKMAPRRATQGFMSGARHDPTAIPTRAHESVQGKFLKVYY